MAHDEMVRSGFSQFGRLSSLTLSSNATINAQRDIRSLNEKCIGPTSHFFFGKDDPWVPSQPEEPPHDIHPGAVTKDHPRMVVDDLPHSFTLSEAGVDRVTDQVVKWIQNLPLEILNP
jgi:hypothetical protein